MPLLAAEVAGFLLGLLFGSFLNVCIARLPFHESVVTPGSRCPHCDHPIRWRDNVPVVSWLWLRARCRDCGAGISWRYPAVELATAVWFAVALRGWWLERAVLPSQGSSPNLAIAEISFLALGILLIGLLVMDWQTHTLPDAFTLTGTAVGFCLVCVQAIFLAPGEADIHLNPAHSLRMRSPGSFTARGDVFLTGPEHLVFGRLLAIVAAALIPLAIRWTYRAVRGQDGLGLGDVKLLAMIAAFLGFWPALLAMILGCMLIFPYAVILLATGRANRKTQLPFGTFLCTGGLLSALSAEPVVAWYRSLF